ncbi:MAG TPA: DUF2004 domain-containing protein [Chitinophagaceae bacterium]|jgi:hypothetical protein|nr:DUF2004 domain-containing protein [Chitinophagaceae bacterium]
MANYSLPHFADIDTNILEEYYDVDIDFNGQEIQIDLNFENKSIDPNRLDIVKRFIENISEFDEKNKKYIEQDYDDDDCDTVKTYIEHHLEEVGKDELADLVNFDDETISPEIQLMNSLRLVRVGLYPDSEDQFAIFDYSIGQDLTQYIVVINTNENGDLDYMTMES